MCRPSFVMMEMTEFRNGLSMDDMFYFNPVGCLDTFFLLFSRMKNEEKRSEKSFFFKTVVVGFQERGERQKF
ncbi:unnamed protein product [Bathycoccus prasinos]